MTENREWWEIPPKGPDPFHWKKLSEVQSKPIEWLWKPYIPKGAVTLIAGDGGYGKSWMTCALAADLSQGRALPGAPALPPQRILMISAEDGLEQVTRPKMELLDANMEMITCSDTGFTITPDTRAHLAGMIKHFDAAVVFLDPLVVYMGGKVDMFRANETREMMNLLVEVARHTNTALVAVHHVRKSGEGSVQNKVMGSADIVNGVRSVVVVDMSKGGQRYMAHAKSNWAANGPTLAYHFGKAGFQWQGLYDPGEKEMVNSRNKRGAAIAWLREHLQDGPVPSQVLLLDAAEQGFSLSTLNRTKDIENPGTVQTFQKDRMWFWALCPKEMERLQREAGIEVPPPAPPPETTKQRAARIMAERGLTPK